MLLDPTTAVETDFDPFATGSIERVVGTTEAQREIWLADRLAPAASLAYNEAVQLTLHGALDFEALRLALDALVARHEALRMTFSADGLQLLVTSPQPVALAVHDLRALDPDGQRARLAAAGDAAVRTPFALEDGPLFRATLFTLAPDLHVLVQSAHHAVCDGWSWSVLCRDLGRLYAQALGQGPQLLAPQRYSDYAAWEQQEAHGPQMQAHVDYWVGRFAGGSLPVLELPLDHPRGTLRTFASRRVDHVLERPLIDALRKFGAARGTSLYAVMLGGFTALLHRLTEQEDVVVGIAAAGQLASEMHELVGHCVNLLPLRLAVDPQQPFEQLVTHCGTTLLDAFEHQTLTYGSLLQKLAVPRDPSRLPLVSVLFNIDQDSSAAAPPFGGLAVEQTGIPRVAENFELFVNGTPVPTGMQLEVQYNSDLYDEATVARWLSMYEQLLRHALETAAQPVSRLNLLSPPQRAALAALQPPATPLPQPALMHGAFVAQARLQPERPALQYGPRRWTYAELEEQTNRLAQAMRARGIGRGQRVGICLERGADMVIALLAVLKSGAAYVPLDPAFPQARLDFYAQDAALALLLTHGQASATPRDWCADAAQRVLDLDTLAWDTLSAEALAPDAALDAQPEDAAYVIYTSGSTGKPKGVCVPHRAVANFLESMRKAPGIGPDDRLAAVTTLSFDIAVAELVLPLSVGAQTTVVPREVAMDGEQLRRLLEDEAITVLQATPGMWRLLIDAQWQGPAHFRGWIGGESVPSGLALDLLDRCGQLWNVYGPTETTVWSSLWQMDRQAIAARGVSIGRPMDNTSIWILDRHLQPCPVGVPGEVCIGGAGVTLGYLDRPELTADRFVITDADGEPALIYRTGDRGRWRNDGLLEHMGRFDFQVKVRGYRIELGEIEARCNEAPGVARSVVIAREDQPGDVRLVAYLALSAPDAFTAQALDQHLRATLPQYMLPQHVVTLDALPQLPNGKIDRKALPAPQAAAASAQGPRIAPRNDKERAVLEIMEQVLNLPGLSVTDDFFALGGHSLLAARLSTLLGRHFALTLPLVTVFEAPTAERLAVAIERRALAGAPPPLTIAHQPDRASAPLTPMQERIVFVEQLYPGRSVYNAPSAYRMSGPLQVEHLEGAFREMVQRQPALRTTFGPAPEGGVPQQRIAPQLDFEFPHIDLSHLPPDEREPALAAHLQEIADLPIDIEHGPLFHVALYHLSPGEYAFAFVPHHLIWDGWSFDLYQYELPVLYQARINNERHDLPPPAASLGDYAEWLAGWMDTPHYQAQLAFWKQRFAAAPEAKALGTDMPRQASMSGAGAMQLISVDNTTSEALRELARQLDVTLSMLTLAVFALMMADAIDTDAVVIANPVRGRDAPELETVMGFFNNVLPLPFCVDRSEAFDGFAAQVKALQLEVMHHQQIPFERLVAEPEFARHATSSGIYQGLFSFQDVRDRPLAFCGVKLRQVHLMQRGATDDLSLWLMDKPTGLEGAINYNADIYNEATGLAFRARYLELLERVLATPHASLQDLLAAPSDSAAHLRRLGTASAAAAVSAPAPTTDAARDTLAAPMDARLAPIVTRPSGAASAHGPALLLPEQAQLAQVWASALGIDVNDIRASDNFFDLGGDSLMAMRVLQQAEQALGFKVEARRYVYESLGQLASAAAAQGGLAEVPNPVTAAPAARPGLLGRLLGRRH